MTQALDRNTIKESIAKAKSQDILHLTSNAADKSSLKSVISEVEKYLSKGVCTITVVRKP